MKNVFLIVNCNDSEKTTHLINNISNYELIDLILVVDNNSKETEKKLLDKIKCEKVTIIYNDDNRGYSNAINIGTKYLFDHYNKFNLYVSNSDIIIFSEEDLKMMLKKLMEDNVGLVGCHILERGLTLKGRKDISVFNDYNKDLPVIKYLVKEDKGFYNDDYYQEEFSKVDIISSCFFLINGDTLKKINYMDEEVFLYYEDNILCKKIRNLGLDVIILNNVKVKHLFGTSVSKIYKNLEKRKIFYQSKYYYHVNYNINSKWDKILLKLYRNLK